MASGRKACGNPACKQPAAVEVASGRFAHGSYAQGLFCQKCVHELIDKRLAKGERVEIEPLKGAA